MNQTIKPNFFIVGAPKCGTTALSAYLKEHKNIVISDPKEPHFFATDMQKMRTTDNKEQYLKYFKDVTDQTFAIGDASVWYLYSKEAIKNIKQFNPDAKIIVMLRNPVEMVPSMHAQHLYRTDEDVKEFAEAWKLNESRELGNNIPKYCRAPQNLNYKKIALYAEQIERLYRYFPKEQVKIILFDDFKKDTKKIYEETLEFLNINKDGREHFPVINENTTSKNYWIKALIVNQPKFIIFIKNIIKKILGKEKLNIASFLNNLNTIKEKRKPLEDTLKQEIIDNYKNDILKLSKILNRNLDNWIK